MSANLEEIKKWGNRNVECLPIVLNPAPPPKKERVVVEYYNSTFSHQVYLSLIPRLFLPPVYDRLQYAKTEGGGRPGRRSHVYDIR